VRAEAGQVLPLVVPAALRRLLGMSPTAGVSEIGPARGCAVTSWLVGALAGHWWGDLSR